MRRQINIGERYRDCSSVWSQWQVERVYLDSLGLPHAVVRNVADDMERRTIACPTLLDRRRFQLVNEESEVAVLRPAPGMGAGHRACGGGFAFPHH